MQNRIIVVIIVLSIGIGTSYSQIDHHLGVGACYYTNYFPRYNKAHGVTIKYNNQAELSNKYALDIGGYFNITYVEATVSPTTAINPIKTINQ